MSNTIYKRATLELLIKSFKCNNISIFELFTDKDHLYAEASSPTHYILIRIEDDHVYVSCYGYLESMNLHANFNMSSPAMVDDIIKYVKNINVNNN